MNEVTVSSANLPGNIEDLSKFVLIGREQLNAVRAAIRAIEKVGTAREVAEQKRKEAQQLAEAVIDAEVRIGELMRAIPKATGNQHTVLLNPEVKKQTKAETLKENGFNIKQGNQFEQMSKHPEAVAAAKAEAREADEIVTRSAVLDKIKEEKKRLEEENAELRRIVVELKDKPPEIREVAVEVTPNDYQKTKKDLEFARRNAERAENDLLKMKQKYEDAREQVEALKLKVGTSTETVKAERDIQTFTTVTNDYIRRYGGHVWAFNEIRNVDETVRADYLKAIKALDAFAQQMIKNIEGGIL